MILHALVALADIIWFALKWWAIIFGSLFVLLVVAAKIDNSIRRWDDRRYRRQERERLDRIAYLAEYGDIDRAEALRPIGGNRPTSDERWGRMAR